MGTPVYKQHRQATVSKNKLINDDADDDDDATLAAGPR